MCCTRLDEIEDAKNRQTFAICAPSHNSTLSGNIVVTKARIDNRKNVKQQYLPYMSAQYGELRPTNDWDQLAGLGHSSKFQRVSSLGFVTAATSLTGGQPNFARSLAVSCADILYMHFRGLLPPNGILPGAILTLRPSLTLSYIVSVTARHLRSGRQRTFAAWYTWNGIIELLQRTPPIFGSAAITLGISAHVSTCMTKKKVILIVHVKFVLDAE